MRIGIDVKTLTKRYTGIAVYVHEMLRFFNEMKVEDEFFLFTPKDFELDINLGPNFHKVIYSTLNGSLSILFFFSSQLKKYKIDVFWGPEHVIPLFRCDAKRVVTIHDLTILMQPQLGTRFNAALTKAFTIPSCKFSDRIITISNSTAHDVFQLAKVCPEKINVIYNGDSPYKYKTHSFNLKEEEEIRAKFDINQDFFLFVGTIEPRKNIPTIIKGFNVYKEHGGLGKLVLAGGLGWRYKESIESIEISRYRKDIIIAGYCSEMEKEFLYKNATALVFPSIYEGFGFPILEAMSVGTGVITTRVSSMPEVGGDCAFYIDDVNDYEGLATLMIKIEAMSPSDRKQLREKSLAWVKRFSREECAKQILSLFHTL